MKFSVRIVEKQMNGIGNLITADCYNINVEADSKHKARKLVRTINDGKYANTKFFQIGRISPKKT